MTFSREKSKFSLLKQAVRLSPRENVGKTVSGPRESGWPVQNLKSDVPFMNWMTRHPIWLRWSMDVDWAQPVEGLKVIMVEASTAWKQCWEHGVCRVWTLQGQVQWTCLVPRTRASDCPVPAMPPVKGICSLPRGSLGPKKLGSLYLRPLCAETFGLRSLRKAAHNKRDSEETLRLGCWEL